MLPRGVLCSEGCVCLAPGGVPAQFGDITIAPPYLRDAVVTRFAAVIVAATEIYAPLPVLHGIAHYTGALRDANNEQG